MGLRAAAADDDDDGDDDEVGEDATGAESEKANCRFTSAPPPLPLS